MKYESGGLPIAIVGTGPSGVATVINKLVDIAYNARGLPGPVNVAVFDTRDEPKLKGDALYPLAGRSARSLHPFYTREPAPGFPTFGEYFDGLIEDGYALPKAAGIAPTWRLVRSYIKYILKLAVEAAEDRVLLDFIGTPIKEIRETTPNGPATILLTDGTSFQARTIVRSKRPPHLAGPEPAEPSLVGEVRRALEKSGLDFVEAEDNAYFVFKVLGQTAVVAHQLDESLLVSRVLTLEPILAEAGIGEVWIVTATAVGAMVRTRFKEQSVKLYTLTEFTALMDLMKQTGVGETFRE